VKIPALPNLALKSNTIFTWYYRPYQISNLILHSLNRASWYAYMSINCIASATRLFIRCTLKYCKLLVQNSSWWRTITCSKHVEDKVKEIIKKKCASCWSCSHTQSNSHRNGPLNHHLYPHLQRAHSQQQYDTSNLLKLYMISYHNLYSLTCRY